MTEVVGWRGIFWFNLAPGLTAAGVIAALLPGDLGRGQGVHARWTALLRDPTQQAVNAGGFFLGGALYGFIGYLPVLVQAVHGGTALDAGLALLPLSVAWTLASNVAGHIVHRTGFRALVRTGTALVAIGGCLAALGPTRWWALLVFGAGMGFTMSSFTVSVQEAAPASLRGTATSLALFSRSIGAALALPIYGWMAGFRPTTASLEDIPDLAGRIPHVFAAVGMFGVVAWAIVRLRFPTGPLPGQPREA